MDVNRTNKMELDRFISDINQNQLLNVSQINIYIYVCFIILILYLLNVLYSNLYFLSWTRTINYVKKICI